MDTDKDINEDINTEEVSKKITINGTNNRYMIKKLVSNHKEEKKIKKRVESEKWEFSREYYKYTTQMDIIQKIVSNNYSHIHDIETSKIFIQQINKKISGYKQQDILKKKYDETRFLNLKSVSNKMVESNLKCRYCQEEMLVLYDISREMKQWSVDRIDNNLGHNADNFHLACLECNLKRRRRTDEKFLFTKQLNLVKMDDSSTKDSIDST